MIYAYQEGDSKTIVTAAASLPEFDSFYARAVAEATDFVSEGQPDFMTMLTDPVFSRLRKPPYVFEHASAEQRDAFLRRYEIEVVGPNAAVTKSEDMLADIEFARASAEGEADTRTIAEVLGLDKEDPWDKRSDEEKAKEAKLHEKYKAAHEEAKKRGALSGDSFGGPSMDGKVHVTDIHTVRQKDGSSVITGARAAKGVHTEDVHPAYAMEEEVRIRKDYQVNPQDYYKAGAASEPQSKRPRDYTFAIYEEDGNTLIAVTPRRTFSFSKKMEDRALTQAIIGSLPVATKEIENGLFEVQVQGTTLDGLRQQMIARGFRESEDFQKIFTPPSQEELLAEERNRKIKDREANPDNYLNDPDYPNDVVSTNPDDYGFGVRMDPDGLGTVVIHVTDRRVYEITKDYQDHSDLEQALEGKLPPGVGLLMEGVYDFDPTVPQPKVEEMLKKALEDAGPGAKLAPEPEDPVQRDLRRAVLAMEAHGFPHHQGIQAQIDAEDKANEGEDTQPDPMAINPADLAPLPQQRTNKAKGGNTPAGVIGEDHLLEEKKDLGPAENFDENGDNIAVANDGKVSIYFKLEVTGQKLDDVIPVLEMNHFPLHAAFVQRDHTAGCWFAFAREASASRAGEILADANLDIEVYAINEMGERIALAAGIKVVDTGAQSEVPVRPWNSRRYHWDLMTDEEKAENRKEWKGSEFIIVLDYDKIKGTDVLITPKAYFYDNDMQALYPEPFDISHILPEDLKPIGDGWYRSTSRDDNHVSADLCVKRGFVDDWMLRLYLNMNQ